MIEVAQLVAVAQILGAAVGVVFLVASLVLKAKGKHDAALGAVLSGLILAGTPQLLPGLL